jgi:hypothetical protein
MKMSFVVPFWRFLRQMGVSVNIVPGGGMIGLKN